MEHIGEEQPDQELQDLFNKIDEKAHILSGGFERLEGYEEIVNKGEESLQFLLNVFNKNHELGWWPMQAICQIAINLDQRISFPEEIRGKYDPIRQTILDWGRQHGYLTDNA